MKNNKSVPAGCMSAAKKNSEKQVAEYDISMATGNNACCGKNKYQYLQQRHN